MSNVTITKKEYKELLNKKLRYEYLRYMLENNVFSPPPTKSRKAILADLKSTKIYDAKFLGSVARGLKRSTYFRA